MFSRHRDPNNEQKRIRLDANGYWRDQNGRFAKAPPAVDRRGLARVAGVIVVAGGLALATGLGSPDGLAGAAADASQSPARVQTQAATIHEGVRLPQTVSIVAPAPTSALRAGKQRDCLVQLAYHEARSESKESIVKRIWTAVWRSRRDDFKSDTICEAVFAPGAFSAFLKGVPPIKDKAALARVERIVDSQMPAILPDLYGGTKCVETDAHTGRCVYTVADTIPTPPVMTYYAEADCYYLGRQGYRYVKRPGRCEPRWAARMVEVAKVKCAAVKRRRCATVFWRAGSSGRSS